MVKMVNIIKQELEIEESLKKKLEFICEFTNTKPTIINGNIRKIDKTNLVYVELHRIIIKNINFLFFNYSTDIFINNLSNKIKISELENYIKSI
jgi:predicted SnoaL-like aldol condensation-catalyzing enzyme